jgi:hypothetical protein
MAEQETDIRKQTGAAQGQQTDTGDSRNTAAAGKADNAKKTAEEEAEEQLKAAIRKIKENIHEDDPRQGATMSLRKILGGDILSAQLVRSQIWLFVLIVVFTIIYIAFRYQCQQDMITIDRLETELKDAKYKALSSSSTLTERCRESRVLEILKQNKDSTLHIADQPPYIINVPE